MSDRGGTVASFGLTGSMFAGYLFSASLLVNATLG